MDLRFDRPFWNQGEYPAYFQNGSISQEITNPWYTSDNAAAPFDQGTSASLLVPCRAVPCRAVSPNILTLYLRVTYGLVLVPILRSTFHSHLPRNCCLFTIYGYTNNCLDFYLILNVAVGGTNGFFPDNVGSKPWLDSSRSAMNGESMTPSPLYI